MAPLPDNNTQRTYLDYFDGVNGHTIMVRHANAIPNSAAMNALHQFLTALDSKLYAITIVGARYSALGQNFSLPVTWPGDPSYGAGSMPLVNAPREFRFIGRSAGGRKVSASLYGVNEATPDNYRLTPAAASAWEDAIDLLQTWGTSGHWRAIDQALTTWKEYVSVNFNSYWEAEARP